jgi:UDP-N-acetylmuramate--alanine ligase
VPLLKRAEALAELMQEQSVVTVAGSHGKTTTTSLVSYMLIEAGLRPTVAIGGILKNIGTNACLGDGKFFVAEADESDGSFLYYQPKYSIITNIDREHLDYYGDFESQVEAFRKFIYRTGAGGCVFYCFDDNNLKSIIRNYPQRSVSFGMKAGAEVYPKQVKFDGLSSEFDCFKNNEFIGHFNLALGGEHNISNALGVIALGLELGLELGLIKKILKEYRGAKRRLEIKFNNGSYTLMDDYAHHPTEITASLRALQNLKFKRLIAVFQPHRYSRTKLLLDEFSKCFGKTDVLFITDIYPAGEAPEEGISAALVCERIKRTVPGKNVEYLAKDEIIDRILKIISPGDLVITLGAGDITRVSDELAEKLTEQN